MIKNGGNLFILSIRDAIVKENLNSQLNFFNESENEINEQFLSTILIIMPLLWYRWFEWKFRNLPENVGLWYVSNIINFM